MPKGVFARYSHQFRPSVRWSKGARSISTVLHSSKRAARQGQARLSAESVSAEGSFSNRTNDTCVNQDKQENVEDRQRFSGTGHHLWTANSKTMDNGQGTMTTLIEDEPNMCWASGPVGMSGGVITPR